METDRVISEPCYNEVIYNRHNSNIIILGAMTWLCCIENHLVMRRVIMRFNCISLANDSLTFQMAILQIHCYILLKKCENPLHCNSVFALLFFVEKV